MRPENVQQPASNSKSTTKTTTTTTKTIYTTTTNKNKLLLPEDDGLSGVAHVEDLGKRATPISSVQAISNQGKNSFGNSNRYQQQVNKRSTNNIENASATIQQNVSRTKLSDSVDGNKLVTTLSTIAAQSGHSRLILVLLKDGDKLQLKIQEMRPAMFEVGGNLKECIKYLEEHQKLIVNLRKQQPTPIDCWMQKYRKIAIEKEPNMSSERKLVYMCMLENLQGCWKALLNQLDERLALLEETCRFYESAKELVDALDRADDHVQVFRKEFLDGPSSINFNEACNELRKLNQIASDCYNMARGKQTQLVKSIEASEKGNLGDARANFLNSDAQNLINYISTYLEPFEKRRIQLGSVISASRSTNHFVDLETETNSKSVSNLTGRPDSSSNKQYSFPTTQSNTTTTRTTNLLREINNFNDLNLVENWLQAKIDQLNSSLLSSLGVNVPDSRSIANKHDQIALECRAIEEATLTFNGRNIHAIKSVDPRDDKSQGDESLFERQKLLATRTRDVITILDARLVLLKRSIDFYLRSKDATSDIARMMRCLQVDNSLQSVQFVSNELELKDVSSVVASGATIISELQQLQLAQQHGQRSRIVNLNLATNGIRAIIDKLNQDLAHLKTMLNQRRLVLLNEDAAKMANNFSNKCHQLQFWLNNHVKSFLIANNKVNVNDPAEVRQFCDNYEQVRVSVQGKTLEVEALLRSLATLTEHFDAKSKTIDDIQRITDELRQDWINATNCLEGRLDLIQKYLAILNSVAVLSKELVALDKFNNSSESISDERTDEDIRSNINQSLLQLANQVRNFKLDAKKNNTQFVYNRSQLLGVDPDGDADGREKVVVNDLNNQQLIDRADELLKRFEEERRLIESEQSNAKLKPKQSDPAHQRPQQVYPPRFTRVLTDQAIEPFKSVELVCETDDSTNCQVDWFMNNFKKIPAAIKHTISSERNQHKLIINNFSSICCGTYLVRASNSAGQASSQCKLRLAGIKETQENEPLDSNGVQVNNEEVDIVTSKQSSWQQQQQQDGVASEGLNRPARDLNRISPASSRTVSSSSSFSQWRPTDEKGKQTRSERTVEETTISRIIQGVDDKVQQDGSSNHPQIRISQSNNSDSDITIDTSTTNINSITSFRDKFPVIKTNYSGELTASSTNQTGSNINVDNNQHLRVSHIDSPDQVSSTTLSRSVSKSPFEGTPQPPMFVQDLHVTVPPCCSRAKWLCIVCGNPPPTVKWIHEKQLVATSKCARSASGDSKSNIYELILNTSKGPLEGQYTCCVSNRLGKASTSYTLTNTQ